MHGEGCRAKGVVFRSPPLIWNILNGGIGFRERIRGIFGKQRYFDYFGIFWFWILLLYYLSFLFGS